AVEPGRVGREGAARGGLAPRRRAGIGNAATQTYTDSQTYKDRRNHSSHNTTEHPRTCETRRTMCSPSTGYFLEDYSPRFQAGRSDLHLPLDQLPAEGLQMAHSFSHTPVLR